MRKWKTFQTVTIEGNFFIQIFSNVPTYATLEIRRGGPGASEIVERMQGTGRGDRMDEVFRGGTSKELKEVAEGNDYMEEAYKDLINLSKDEAKRLEYEVREKAWRDYQARMEGAEHRGIKRGMEHGIEIGQQRGIEIGRRQAREELLAVLIEFCQQGVLTPEQAAEKANMPVEEFCKLLSCH